MNAQTERLHLAGAAGIIETAIDRPAADVPARGTAVIAHPHPLFGGTLDNKVVQTLARAFVQCGWTAVRFNFRGVGASAGTYDEGRAEADDLRAVIAQAAPDGPLALAGFSFGSVVMSHVLHGLWRTRPVEKIVFVGTAASRFTVADVPPEAHLRTLVVHGEADDTVPLADAMAWARPQTLPVTVVPAGGHFFHGQLPLLKGLVVRHLLSPAA
ncbi:alpha/beta hydrolase [uncultured Xylophilus sp.]|uniref:alpha/beta hydrolase n=1 Tax=uncultured Xylophilus sp. TaxID=296832 RepID=UPI0025DAF9B4|nr:alpha/beta hydrolase [uncultured Xylophilus sp.]